MTILRDYQLAAIDKLRENIRAGHKAQVLVLPTGGGKTVVATHLMQEADRKQSKSCFVVDRRAIVNQTSATFDRYGLDHGVIMADHLRNKPFMRTQVASAQTLEARGFMPDLNLLVVDECHSTRKQIAAFIKAHPNVVTIGLSATPFTAGMADLYSAVVNVTTTDKLTADGWLVPLKVYAAKSPDMTGAKIVAGEWAESDMEERGLKIVGDVVTEWRTAVMRHFGRPVKTIAFSASVAHGEEMCRQFNAAGYRFCQVSYKDGNNAKREELLAEFAKPDSEIVGLVSCEALAKGFDQVDILCGISARPYRKSLSSHIQQLGRVMRPAPGKEYALWLCIEKGSRVLTQRGMVPIEAILLTDRIWDGEDFVSHQGAICRGVKRTISYAGLRATPDHPVWTQEGWRPFGDCAKEQIPIATTGFGGQAVRESEGYFSDSVLAGAEEAQSHTRFVRVRNLRIQGGNLAAQSRDWQNGGLSELRPAPAGISAVALCASSGHEGSLYAQEEFSVRELRRARNRIQIQQRQGGDVVDHEEFGHPVQCELLASSGSNQCGRSLRAGEPALVRSKVEHEQSSRVAGNGSDARIPIEASGNSVRRCDAQDIFRHGDDARTGCREMGAAFDEAEGEVWDILCCGPRNRFTVEGLLVHNCHSSNYLRFYNDMVDVFANGVTSLSDAAKKDAEPRKDDEKLKKDLLCPACHYVLPPGCPSCPACGRERTRRSLIETMPGELVPVEDKRKKPEPPPPLWQGNPSRTWQQLCGSAMQRKKGDVVAARKWALGQYKSLFDKWPNEPFNPAAPPHIDMDLQSRITANTIRWAKSRAQRMKDEVRAMNLGKE